MPSPVIHDFIYLDWERVRSFAAQTFGGIPESATDTTSRQGAVQGDAKVGLPGIGKAGVAADYTLTRSSQETRSLHHWIYLELERNLRDHDLLVEVDEAFALRKWAPDVFSDGGFVAATGPIQIIDYAWIASTLADFDSFARIISDFTLMGDLTPEERGRRQKERQALVKQARDMKTADMATVIERFYENSIQVRIAPARAEPRRGLIGVAFRESFYDSAMGLARKYGQYIDAGWRVVGQVNVPGRETTGRIATGNTMDDALEALAGQLTVLAQTSSSVSYPAFSMTPLAIYRTVS